MAAHDHALQELSRAPLSEFLTSRKRLSAEARGKGDGSGAAEIAKRRKPTASVWAVNQLYWQARAAFDDMISGAARLRKGDVSATKPYRDATAALRKRAAIILKEGGLGASARTRIGSGQWRRVSTSIR